MASILSQFLISFPKTSSLIYESFETIWSSGRAVEPGCGTMSLCARAFCVLCGVKFLSDFIFRHSFFVFGSFIFFHISLLVRREIFFLRRCDERSRNCQICCCACSYCSCSCWDIFRTFSVFWCILNQIMPCAVLTNEYDTKNRQHVWLIWEAFIDWALWGKNGLSYARRR